MPERRELYNIVAWSIIGMTVAIMLFYWHSIQTWILYNQPKLWMPIVTANLQDFLTLTLSVIVEATPFLILGVVISALIRRFAVAHTILHRLPKNTIARRLILSIIGMALPVCECGNVPVARSLMRHGLTPADTICFLFAAPILNPITILTTATAFAATPIMTWWRIGFAIIIVQIIAFVASKFHTKHILQPDFIKYCGRKESTSLESILAFSRNEFWQLFRMLVFGALLAAATQVFIPRDIITTVSTNPILSVLAMIGLGFVVSICSSVDAFFALAYRATFTQGAILSFLLSGPMVDIKMIALLKSTFTARFVTVITLLSFALAFLAGIGVNYYVG